MPSVKSSIRVLARSVLLFWVYLLVITLVFAGVLAAAYAPAAFDGQLVRWVKHAALSLGSAALVWSFGLPVIIRKAQLERLQNEVERRYEEGKLPPRDDAD